MGEEQRTAADDIEASDETLMVAYVQGDQQAFRELFQRYAPLLTGLMRVGARSVEEYRDLVQQTFLQLHRARHDYRAGQAVRPWLLTIAYNLKRDLWRRRWRRPEVPLEQVAELSNGRTPAGALERGRQAARLHAALVELPDRQRQVIELHWFGGLSFAAVARTVGASEGAVKVLAHRGYRRLRELLGESAATEGE